MKKYLVFIIILFSNCSQLFNCGYYPFGEDIRLSLFLPKYFNYKDYEAFYYNSELFGWNYEQTNKYESNVYDWYNYFNKQVKIDEINLCLNIMTLTDININSENQFIKFLYANKHFDVLQYLIIAKKCEEINNYDVDDPWERNNSFNPYKLKILETLKKCINEENNKYIKRKYVFLAIRTAYYCNESNTIKYLFDTYFTKSTKDYLYYWALFFYSFQNKDRNIDVANIMAYSIEKKYASYYYFNRSFNLENALSKAKKKQEIANVYAYASVQRLESNLDYLQKIYINSNKSRILDFLLLREINKIEDWIYTPYYTNFLPSIENSNQFWSENSNNTITTNTLRNRSESDRLYAENLLKFVQSVNYKKLKDTLLWKSAEIQLLFISRKYTECLKKISIFEKKYNKNEIWEQIEKIKALCIVSNQIYGNAIISEIVKPIILKNKDDAIFLFFLGRELEFKGNLIDGLALISHQKRNVEQENDNIAYTRVYKSFTLWQGNRLKYSGNLVFFTDYFNYIDFVYSANDLKIVTKQLSKIKLDNFTTIIYKQLLLDKNYLLDLLGTKFIRENNLKEALITFESIGNKYWEENYNEWERDKFNEYYTFKQNPFYDFQFTKSFIPHYEKYVVTKLSVTQHLVKYLELANNNNTQNRDYYYFLIANCYLNMTQYGHSWMLRRFNSSTSTDNYKNESYIDEIEYRNCRLAQNYYHLAYKFAKTDKFKALCLRMEDYASENIRSKYKKLKSKFPEYYDDLSNCENLGKYFSSRR